jgi:hypothetical protein
MKEENENIEQRLDHLKNGKAFRIPENYFEEFAERLRARIDEESKPAPRISWFMYLKPSFGIAAVLLIALLLVKLPVNLSLRNQELLHTRINSPGLNMPSSDTLASNLSGELTAAFESLVQLPQSQFLSTLEEDVNQGDKSQIDPKELEEYLADNSFDYEIIGNN